VINSYLRSSIIAIAAAMAVLISAFFSPLNFTTAYAAAVPDGQAQIKIHAKGAVVMNADTGDLLYSKNGDSRFYPASTTKLMTTIVAIEKCKNLDEVATVSKNAVYGIGNDSSHIALRVGEKVTVRQLLYGMMLASGNDAAVATAEHVGGSIEAFARLMNQEAEKLGCSNTHFSDPHGLYHKNHYTTPHDLAKIMRHCIGSSEFVKIASSLKYTIPKTNKSKKKRVLWNNHRMIRTKYYAYKGFICGKSGYVTKSKFNLVSYASRNGMRLIAVVMRGNDPVQDVKDTSKLLDHYFDNYKSVNISAGQTGIKSVDTALKHNVPVTYDGTLNAMIPENASASDLKYKTEIKDDLTAPVKPGTVIGKVTAHYDGHTAGVVNIRNTETIDDTAWKIIRLCIGAAICITIIFIIFRLSRLWGHKKGGHRPRRHS